MIVHKLQPFLLGVDLTGPVFKYVVSPTACCVSIAVGALPFAYTCML